MKVVACGCPQLTSLSISGCHHITDARGPGGETAHDLVAAARPARRCYREMAYAGGAVTGPSIWAKVGVLRKLRKIRENVVNLGTSFWAHLWC